MGSTHTLHKANLGLIPSIQHGPSSLPGVFSEYRTKSKPRAPIVMTPKQKQANKKALIRFFTNMVTLTLKEAFLKKSELCCFPLTLYSL